MGEWWLEDRISVWLRIIFEFDESLGVVFVDLLALIVAVAFVSILILFELNWLGDVDVEHVRDRGNIGDEKDNFLFTSKVNISLSLYVGEFVFAVAGRSD